MTWRLSEYEPVGQLGTGSTGTVFAARDIATGTMVAIRYLDKSVTREPGFADRYRREAAVLASLDDPYLCQLYEYVERPEGAAVVSELVDGMSLRAILDHGDRLDERAALFVLKGALLGLAGPHRRGVLHRDLRPENILVTTAGDVKVTDIGLRATADPRYRAPEQWVGQPASPASDVWSAAATLYECLTGRPPRTVDGRPLGRLGIADEAELRTVAPAGAPDRLRRLLTRDLGMQPDRRARDAAAMLNELDLAAVGAYGPDWETAGRTALVARLGVAATAPRVAAGPSSRGRRWVAVAAGLVVVLVGAGAAVWTGMTPGRDSGAPTNRPSASAFEHTPDATVGPTVPASGNPAGNGDHRIPDRPLGLKIIGRSVTAVSLDWAPSRDNVKVAGYIVTRNGHPVGTTFVPGFTDRGLTAQTKYAFAVTAFDAAGNRSAVSPVVFATTLAAPDVTPPTPPTNVHATGVSDTRVVLTWGASTDDVGVAGYDVFRSDATHAAVKVGSVTQPGFTDTGRTPDTTYTYSVRAFDTTNNASALVATVPPVTTLPGPDVTRPSAPTGLTASATGQTTVSLSWNAATDNVGVVAYKVYRDGSATPVGVVSGTTFDDTGLSASTTYSYRVLAVDAAMNASKLSAAASVTTLDPPPVPAVASITLDATPVDTSTCTTTISATIVVTGGALDVDLSYMINTSSGHTTVSFAGPGTKTVSLDDQADGTADGVAYAHDTASGVSGSVTWTAPPECIPSTPTPSPTPTDTDTTTPGGDATDPTG